VRTGFGCVVTLYMASNKEISRLLNLYAELLQLHGKDERLSQFLSGASYRIRQIEEPIRAMTPQALSTLFRPEIVSIINELTAQGNISQLEELIQLTPPGLFDMMRIKGLGGKKLAILWRQAKIDSVEELLKKARAGEIAEIKGFGSKTQANIINAIENLHAGSTQFHYADLADVADNLVSVLQKTFKTELVSLCGEIRRQTLTVKKIEILTTAPAKKIESASVRRILHLSSVSVDHYTGHTLDEFPVEIYRTTKKDFYRQLFIRTGNERHVQKVLASARAFISEEQIYRQAGLPFIVPEMREDVAEWYFVKQKAALITDEDIKGVVHNHTTWSDGVDTIESFVKACKKRGYEYVVISDHSKNAHYAGGLKEDKVLRQMKEIDGLNKKIPGIRIFKGIECDILVSGELDYDQSLLKQFDMVIVSIHQLLKMNEEKATARLIKAIENPYTTILGHVTGRQLLIRSGYPVDFKKVIDACAANGVVIELNTNPYRLDIDWSHIPYAMEKGVMISLNPDAHSIGEIDNIRWGVSAARKGGLTTDMTWNAMGLAGIENWLRRRRQANYTAS
jgi:DNA polymerase (family 10)